MPPKHVRMSRCDSFAKNASPYSTLPAATASSSRASYPAAAGPVQLTIVALHDATRAVKRRRDGSVASFSDASDDAHLPQSTSHTS